MPAYWLTKHRESGARSQPVPSNDALPAAELYYRGTPLTRRLGRIGSFIIAALFVLLGIAYASEPEPHLSTGRTVLAGVIWVVGVVVSVTYIERSIVKPYVRATPSGLYIYNGL